MFSPLPSLLVSFCTASHNHTLCPGKEFRNHVVQVLPLAEGSSRPTLAFKMNNLTAEVGAQALRTQFEFSQSPESLSM